MKKFLKNQKGVTMIEVLVTIAILAIVVAPCLSSFVMAQRGNVKAKETTEAYTAAANLMEELKGLRYSEVIAKLWDESYSGEEARDGVHVRYRVTTFVEIWICIGEDKDKPIENNQYPEEYILKGVIVNDD